MLIRRWIFQDNNEIAQMEQKYFVDPWNVKMLGDTFINNNFLGFVAISKDKIIGYVGSIFSFELGEITMIAVDEEYRRSGVASALLDELSKELKKNEVNSLMLEVRRSNYNAQKCYLKYGFHVLAIREKYYQNCEDALIMQKEI